MLCAAIPWVFSSTPSWSAILSSSLVITQGASGGPDPQAHLKLLLGLHHLALSYGKRFSLPALTWHGAE